MIKFLSFVVHFAVLAQLFMSTVFAMPPNPCRDDQKKFCKDAGYSPTKIKDCLKKNMTDLSAECKKSIESKKDVVTSGSVNCWTELKKICKDPTPFGGGFKKCYEQHKAEVSETCRTQFDNMKGAFTP